MSALFRASFVAIRVPRGARSFVTLGSMDAAGQKMCAQRAESGPPSIDRAIGALAARQHGVVSRDPATRRGPLGPSRARRAAAGRLHRVHTRRLRRRAHGPHPTRTLDGRRPRLRPGRRPQPHVRRRAVGTAPDRHRRHRRHRPPHRETQPPTHPHPPPRTLQPNETTTKRRIPVTTPARTILDLAATLRGADLEQLLDRNEILELTDYPSLAALARGPPRPPRSPASSWPTLHTHDAGTTLTSSGLEVLFRRSATTTACPRPASTPPSKARRSTSSSNRPALIVETDSWRYHKTRRAFENDRARDALTTAAGYRTLRFTDRRLTNDPAAVAAAIAATLASPDNRPRTPA